MTTPTTPAADAVSAIQALIDDEAQYLCVVVAKTHLALLLSEIAAATARESALIAERDALRAQAASVPVDRGHLSDLRYVLNVLKKMGAQDEVGHGDVLAAIVGMNYVIARTEAAPQPQAVVASSPATAVDAAALLQEAHGQIRHLIDDLSVCVDDDGLTRYVPRDAVSLTYSNLIGALIPLAERIRAALQASRQPQAQQGVAAPLELKVCHSQNASQTPQTDLSLMAAPQEWSPAYTRGPARQSAPVAAVPAMVPLTEEQMVSAVRPLCNTDQVAERLVAVSIDEYRAIEAASAKLNDLAVGDGAQPIKDTP